MKSETKVVEKSEIVKVPNAKRQTVITKGISRTIQTAKYFSLTIQHIAQDTIEWETLEEREKKQDNLTLLAIKDFIQSHDTVLDRLKLGEMCAFKTDHIEEQAIEKDPKEFLEDFDELG